jgi:hypothetical protein
MSVLCFGLFKHPVVDFCMASGVGVWVKHL